MYLSTGYRRYFQFTKIKEDKNVKKGQKGKRVQNTLALFSKLNINNNIFLRVAVLLHWKKFLFKLHSHKKRKIYSVNTNITHIIKSLALGWNYVVSKSLLHKGLSGMWLKLSGELPHSNEDTQWAKKKLRVSVLPDDWQVFEDTCQVLYVTVLHCNDVQCTELH